MLGEPRYLEAAEAAARFVLAELRRPDGRLLRSRREGRGAVPGFCDDYAALALGLLALFRADGDPAWFGAAAGLVEDMVRLFGDPATGAFFTTGRDAEPLIARPLGPLRPPGPLRQRPGRRGPPDPGGLHRGEPAPRPGRGGSPGGGALPGASPGRRRAPGRGAGRGPGPAAGTGDRGAARRPRHRGPPRRRRGVVPPRACSWPGATAATPAASLCWRGAPRCRAGPPPTSATASPARPPSPTRPTCDDRSAAALRSCPAPGVESPRDAEHPPAAQPRSRRRPPAGRRRRLVGLAGLPRLAGLAQRGAHPLRRHRRPRSPGPARDDHRGRRPDRRREPAARTRCRGPCRRTSPSPPPPGWPRTPSRPSWSSAATTGPQLGTSSRADVIVLLLLPADGSDPVMVSIPRDLYLPNPCTGGYTRVNATLNGCGEAATGPELLSVAVEDFTGVQIDHFAVFDFEGFQAISRPGGWSGDLRGLRRARLQDRPAARPPGRLHSGRRGHDPLLGPFPPHPGTGGRRLARHARGQRPHPQPAAAGTAPRGPHAAQGLPLDHRVLRPRRGPLRRLHHRRRPLPGQRHRPGLGHARAEHPAPSSGPPSRWATT